MQKFIIFIATGFYSGRLPKMPGTWGTAVGVVLYWLIKDMPAPAYAAFLVAFIALSVWVAGLAQQILKTSDPKPVVIDEIAGFFVTMAFHVPHAWLVLAGFFLFRIFDIVKPWPARWAEEKFDDGRGIVMDDVIAGIYANVVLWLLSYFL